eukprot:CAMPEP_0197537274 /NCGR_PEP_ID=MMETSP1318-20131121/56353_1 /TAXON_ID=552666 /ORGANISM="Partenskyella glossopodia, Strain RCC365" /LENGTH=193 /DNA_ID=CAMNT_0043095407 /DNA_START=482 /DNA_END=1063 /DNA_ORIENTATION=-
MAGESSVSGEYIDVVAAVTVSEVYVVALGGNSEPGRAVRQVLFLAEVAFDLPHDSAVQFRFGQLSLVVGMVEILFPGLPCDLQPMRHPIAQLRPSPRQELSGGPVRPPSHEAVLVVAHVLVSQIYVVFRVHSKSVAVLRLGAFGKVEKVWHVFISEAPRARDDIGLRGLCIGRVGFGSLLVQAMTPMSQPQQD